MKFATYLLLALTISSGAEAGQIARDMIQQGMDDGGYDDPTTYDASELNGIEPSTGGDSDDFAPLPPPSLEEQQRAAREWSEQQRKKHEPNFIDRTLEFFSNIVPKEDPPPMPDPRFAPINSFDKDDK